LHLLPFGEGLGNLLDFSDEAKWLVVEYETKLAIDLKGKVKIPNGTVVYCGDRNGATIWLRDHAERACKITGSTNTGGVRSTNTGGDSSTCKAGDMGAIAIWWWDKSTQRKRLTVGYVGENGIAPNTFYRCDDAGKLIKVA
jgi:ribulose-5-phosphate 4-epimerase/fuculose-1-phosphate aldolase